MSVSINQLIAYIAQHHQFTEAKYPELAGADERKRLAFAVRHVALHYGKTAGKVIAVAESVDHGGDINIDDLKADIRKSLINSLRLAELVGMNEEELLRSIEQQYKDPINA